MYQSGFGPFFIDRVGPPTGVLSHGISQTRACSRRARANGRCPARSKSRTGYVRPHLAPKHPGAKARSRFGCKKSGPAARLQRAVRSRRRHRSGGTRSVVRARSLGGGARPNWNERAVVSAPAPLRKCLRHVAA
jgi:hypothetical protein